MDTLDLKVLIDDISKRLIQVNDQWDRYTCNEYVDDTFVPTMHDNTRSTAEYLISIQNKLRQYISAIDMQSRQGWGTNALSGLLYDLNRNNELYSMRKDRFKTYEEHFSKRAQDVRKQVHKVGYYTKQEDLEMGREGDWYEKLNEMCNEYLQLLKPYLTDQEQNKPQPEVAKGRKSGHFENRIISKERESILKKLHTMIDGKKGKDVALIIRAAMGVGWITKPTSTEVLNEFGNIGDKSGFNKYMNETYETKGETRKSNEDEVKQIISQLQNLL